jgi:DNA-binding MarR family transcriptional regulator
MSNDILDQCAAKVIDTGHLIMRTVGTEMSKRSPVGLSIRQIIAMMVIRDQQGTSLSVLAEHLGCTISAASKLLDGLVEVGCVVRAENGQDRRKLMLMLSDDGRRTLEKVSQEEMSFLRDRLSALTGSECLLVNLAMDLLRTALNRDLVGSSSKPAMRGDRKQ